MPDAPIIRTLADLRKEVAHRRVIACEAVGPISLDLAEQLLAAVPVETSGYAQIGGSLLADTRLMRRRNQAEEEWDRAWRTHDRTQGGG